MFHILRSPSRLWCPVVIVLAIQVGFAQDNASTKDASQTQSAATKAVGIIAESPARTPSSAPNAGAGSPSALLLGPGDEVEINVYGAADLSEHTHPAEMAASNVNLQPGDTVVVPRAGIVYVLGEVTRPGGYVLNEAGGVTALQVGAVAGGPTHLAAYGKTTVLHRTAAGFQEQKIDLKKLLRGKIHDIPLQNDDILLVPTSGVKSAINAGALVAAAGTTAVYRVPFRGERPDAVMRSLFQRCGIEVSLVPQRITSGLLDTLA